MFVDTSVWYAAADDDDSRTAAARGLLAAGEPLVTSDHVLVETCLLVHRRLGLAAARKFWAAMRNGVARTEVVGPADLEAGWNVGLAFPDQGFSIVDQTSFAVMERLGVHRAASFDAHFSVYRFGPRRDRAFTVVSAPT